MPQSTNSDDGDADDMMAAFRRQVAAFDPSKQLPTGVLDGKRSARGTSALLKKRTESLLDVRWAAGLASEAPAPQGYVLEERSAEAVSPPPPPPPSMEDAFAPLPLRPVLPYAQHFHLEADDVPPNLAEIPLPELYPLLGSLLAAPDFVLNHATFWLLDVLLEALLTAQRDDLLTPRGQAALVAWFGFLLTTLREHAWSREQLFAHLETAMVEAATEACACEWQVLTPDQLPMFRQPSPLPSESGSPSRRLSTDAEAAAASASPRRLSPTAADASAVASASATAAASASAAVAVAETGSPSGEGSASTLSFDPAAATAELGVIARLLYAGFANSFVHDVVKMAFCSPQEVVLCPLERQIHFPKTLRPLPPPPKKEKKEKGDTAAGKGKGKGKKDKKGGKGDKKGSKKSDKSDKKSGKSDKKGSKKGKSDGGAGDGGGKGKKGKKGKKGAVVEEVVEEAPPPPENPLAKYRVEEVEWQTLEEIARLNKETVCRLQDACPERFFTELFPPKEKKEKPEKPGKKDKKDKKGKGKDKGKKDKGKKKK